MLFSLLQLVWIFLNQEKNLNNCRKKKDHNHKIHKKVKIVIHKIYHKTKLMRKNKLKKPNKIV